MTKAQERGENEITAEVKREAARTGRDVCAILADGLRRAKRAGDKGLVKKLERTQKYLGCRNVTQRGQS